MRDGILESQEKYRLALSITLAALAGLARSPSGNTRLLVHLFTEAIPEVVFLFREARSMMLPDCTQLSELTLTAASMFCDFCEGHLHNLPTLERGPVFAAAGEILSHFSEMLTTDGIQQCSGREPDLTEDNSHLIAFGSSDALVLVFTLLSALSNQDSMDDNDGAIISSLLQRGVKLESAAPRVPFSSLPTFNHIVDVLFYGIETMAPLLNVSLLQSSPLISDQYFSLLAYLLSAHDEAFLQWVCKNPETGRQLLRMLVSKMVWAAGAADSASACLAMQALQFMATFHLTQLKSGRLAYSHEVVGPQAYSCSNSGEEVGLESGIFEFALHHLLEALLFPHTCNHDIAADCLNTCGTLLLSLIALSPNSFISYVQRMIYHQPPAQQSALSDCFTILTNNDGVDMTKTDRMNCRKFVGNMRVFIRDVRPLLMYR